MKRTWFAVWLLDFMLWCSLPSRIGNANISLQIHDGTGTPGNVIFIITDADQQPMAGVSVLSQSYSGSTQVHHTDKHGVAEIHPGESEVLGVFIDSQGFGFENRLSGGFGTVPDCADGLTIRAKLNRSRQP